LFPCPVLVAAGAGAAAVAYPSPLL